jgi:hypothetical protein
MQYEYVNHFLFIKKMNTINQRLWLVTGKLTVLKS